MVLTPTRSHGDTVVKQQHQYIHCRDFPVQQQWLFSPHGSVAILNVLVGLTEIAATTSTGCRGNLRWVQQPTFKGLHPPLLLFFVAYQASPIQQLSTVGSVATIFILTFEELRFRFSRSGSVATGCRGNLRWVRCVECCRGVSLRHGTGLE